MRPGNAGVKRPAGKRRPSLRCAIDSQSVKTAEGGREIGNDGGKKVHGRKRHILVDTLGLVIAVVVTAANVDDARAAQDVPRPASEGRDFPRLEVVFADILKYHNYALYGSAVLCASAGPTRLKWSAGLRASGNSSP